MVRRGVPRPVAVQTSAVALVVVSFGLFGVAKTTGSGWLIVLLAGIAAVVLLSVVLPAPAVVRVHVAVEAPADATAGQPMHLVLDVSGTGRPLLVRVRESDGAWTAVAPPLRGRLDATPARRGVVRALTVDVRCAAPLGLVWWGRALVVTLARPIEVGPRPADVGHDPRLAVTRGDDLVRGVRDYQHGDPIKTVHWPSSARHGQLMVKELEAAAAPPLTVVVDLGPPGDGAEGAASLAAGVALSGLRAGMAVSMLTVDDAGPVAGRVGTPVEVSRRLARAVTGRPPEPPATGGVVVRVDADGVHGLRGSP
jgi:uncharacterized protein (DUF58 family)